MRIRITTPKTLSLALLALFSWFNFNSSSFAEQVFYRDALAAIELIRSEADSLRSLELISIGQNSSASEATEILVAELRKEADSIERIISKLHLRLAVLQNSSSRFKNTLNLDSFQFDPVILDIPDDQQTETMEYSRKDFGGIQHVDILPKTEVIKIFRAYCTTETQEVLTRLDRTLRIAKSNGPVDLKLTPVKSHKDYTIVTMNLGAFFIDKLLGEIETVKKVERLLNPATSDTPFEEYKLQYKEFVLSKSSKPKKVETQEEKAAREASFLPKPLKTKTRKGKGAKNTRTQKPTKVKATTQEKQSDDENREGVDQIVEIITERSNQPALEQEGQRLEPSGTLFEFHKASDDCTTGRIYEGKDAEIREIELLRQKPFDLETVHSEELKPSIPGEPTKGVSKKAKEKEEEEIGPESKEIETKTEKTPKFYSLSKKAYLAFQVLFKIENRSLTDQELIRLIVELLEQSDSKSDYLQQKGGQITVRLNGHIFRFDPTHGRDAHRVYEAKATSVRKHLEKAGISPDVVKPSN